jgi:hypothetical protein
MATQIERHVTVPVDGASLDGELFLPPGATGLVTLATGSGVDRPRTGALVSALRDRDLGTLVVDLLTDAEARVPRAGFDIDLLTDRLVATTAWLRGRETLADRSLGYVGVDTAAAAALSAAARLGDDADAVVSLAGRVDLASGSLDAVRAPALFVVDGADPSLADLARAVGGELGGPCEVVAVDGAETAADRTATWLADRLS